MDAFSGYNESMNHWLKWIFRGRNQNPLMVWREVMWVFALILIIWGMYRFLLSYPVWFEETVLKGLVFGGPVFWVSFKKNSWSFKDLGITAAHLLPAVHLGLLLGFLLGLVGQLGNLLRYGQISLTDYGLTSETLGGFLILSLVTAFWEQLVFAGYMLRRIFLVTKNELIAVMVVALLFVAIHLPALILIQKMGGPMLIVALLMLFLLQMGCGILRLRINNLAAPLLAHALWGVTIYLFR
jgi:hypothetical protein